jgi:hypothetical protein
MFTFEDPFFGLVGVLPSGMLLRYDHYDRVYAWVPARSVS